MDTRYIQVRKCKECPYCHEDDGGGHCSSFTTCEKFNIMLHDWDGPEDHDIYKGIHPDCMLPIKKQHSLKRKMDFHNAKRKS